MHRVAEKQPGPQPVEQMNSENLNCIILRKTPYRESSLIAAGITAEFGRLDLLIKGAKKVSSKSLPAVDLFREINITIKPDKEGLQSVYSAEMVSCFDDIAMHKKNYLDACEISKFILRNIHQGVPSPVLYAALKNALRALTSPTTIQYTPLVKLVFLEEHGLIPELPPEKVRESKLLEELLKSAKGYCHLPDISEEYMNLIYEWIDSLCKYNSLFS